MSAHPSSWIEVPQDSRFPLHRLPLGTRRRPDGSHAVCTRVGDRVADLRVLAEVGVYEDTGAAKADFAEANLNALLAHGRDVLARVRARTIACLDDDPNYWDFRQRAEIFLLPAESVRLILPIAAGDYTRFARSDESTWAHREARAGNLLVEGDVDWAAASADDRLRGRTVTREWRPMIGIGLVVAGGDEDAFPYGLCGLADWTTGAAAEVDELRAGRRTVLAPWVTPLAAFDDGDVPVEAVLSAGERDTRGRVLLRERVRPQCDELLAALLAEGAVVRAGDLLARSVGQPETPDDRWIVKDVAALSVDTWTNPPAG